LYSQLKNAAGDIRSSGRIKVAKVVNLKLKQELQLYGEGCVACSGDDLICHRITGYWKTATSLEQVEQYIDKRISQGK